jgi:hypothetical protein
MHGCTGVLTGQQAPSWHERPAGVWACWLVVAKFIIAQERHAIFGLELCEDHPSRSQVKKNVAI